MHVSLNRYDILSVSLSIFACRLVSKTTELYLSFVISFKHSRVCFFIYNMSSVCLQIFTACELTVFKLYVPQVVIGLKTKMAPTSM